MRNVARRSTALPAGLSQRVPSTDKLSAMAGRSTSPDSLLPAARTASGANAVLMPAATAHAPATTAPGPETAALAPAPAPARPCCCCGPRALLPAGCLPTPLANPAQDFRPALRPHSRCGAARARCRHAARRCRRPRPRQQRGRPPGATRWPPWTRVSTAGARKRSRAACLAAPAATQQRPRQRWLVKQPVRRLERRLRCPPAARPACLPRACLESRTRLPGGTPGEPWRLLHDWQPHVPSPGCAGRSTPRPSDQCRRCELHHPTPPRHATQALHRRQRQWQPLPGPAARQQRRGRCHCRRRPG
jgi:hypothetical protein